MHRLESEIVSRVTNLASPWPVSKHFHEVRNNFGVVEVVIEGDRAVATFDLYVHIEGASAKPLYRVRAEWPHAPCPQSDRVLPSRP